jgi:hypothetical protein
MSKFIEIPLTQIDASNNIRRASPILSNMGVDVLELCKTKALGISMSAWSHFMKAVGKDAKLIGIARSLGITGQIHPITVVAQDDGTYKCISGQRRYIGMVILDCLRNLLRYGETEEIKAAKALFEPEGLDLPKINYAKLEKIKDDLTITAEIKKSLSEEEAQAIAFAANEETEPLTDIDWANWITASREKTNPVTSAKYTWEELAKIAGKSVGWLRQRQNLLVLPKEWKEKLDTREITITAASTYASEIIERKASKDKPVPEPTAAAKLADEKTPPVEPITLEDLEQAYDFPESIASDDDGTVVTGLEDAPKRAGESISAEDAELTTADPEAEPAKDWTEGTRKKRSAKKPKMMKYDEVFELLRSLEKTDEHGIKILAAVLKMEISAAEDVAGTALDAV